MKLVPLILFLLDLWLLARSQVGDAILYWNQVALEAVANDHTPSIVGIPQQGGPTRTARALAIIHAAMYDAVNVIDGSYTPYLSEPGTQYSSASIEAAVAQAALSTLHHYYSQQTHSFFIDKFVSAIEFIPPEPRNEGLKVGADVARKLIEARAVDGSDIDDTYVPDEASGKHIADPLHPNQGFLTPSWGRVTPFTLNYNNAGTVAFRSPPPPALNSAAYATAYNEVKSLGGDGIQTHTNRTAEQSEIGYFWGYDGTPQVGTPPRLYNQIAREIAITQGNTLVENARLFALINLALADAGIQCWESKYLYNLWRPIAGIRQGSASAPRDDDNPNTQSDPSWSPLGIPPTNIPGEVIDHITPNFPSYPSGHATFGAAFFRMLENFYGTDNFRFDVISDELNGGNEDANGIRPFRIRSYSRFSQAMRENALSRVYLGVHWRFDSTEGIRAGKVIADHVFANFLQKRP